MINVVCMEAFVDTNYLALKLKYYRGVAVVMPVKINHKGLERLKENVKGLEGENLVRLDDLLNNDFMSQHTNFSSLNEMFEHGDFNFESKQEFERFLSEQREEIDGFVERNTNFKSWDDMIQRAIGEHVSKTLNKGLK